MSSTALRPSRWKGERAAALVMAVTMVGLSGLLTGTVAAAAGPGASPGADPTEQQAAPVGEPIPLTPVSGLTSLDATVDITVDGTVNGKPTQGGLTARVTSNDQGMSQIDVTGSLLGDVVAQVGGSAVNLFRPKKVSVYSVPEGTYVVVGGFFDVCFKPEDSQATEALQQLSPQSLMTMLTSSDVARGTFVADEDLDGTAVKHYRISGETFLAAAQGSTEPTVAQFAQLLRSAADFGPVRGRGGWLSGRIPGCVQRCLRAAQVRRRPGRRHPPHGHRREHARHAPWGVRPSGLGVGPTTDEGRLGSRRHPLRIGTYPREPQGLIFVEDPTCCANEIGIVGVGASCADAVYSTSSGSRVRDARENTARVVKDLRADILCLIEVEDRETLRSEYDTVTHFSNQASDHGGVWARLSSDRFGAPGLSPRRRPRGSASTCRSGRGWTRVT